MQLGTHQVSAQVNEAGTHFLCKYKTLPGDELEIVAPLGSKIDIVDNEIGSTYERDGRLYVKFKQLLAENKKVWESVHSGNVNPIVLPTKMPAYTFLRIPSNEDMGTYPKR
jgi:putative protease